MRREEPCFGADLAAREAAVVGGAAGLEEVAVVDAGEMGRALGWKGKNGKQLPSELSPLSLCNRTIRKTLRSLVQIWRGARPPHESLASGKGRFQKRPF